jgi:hypothetical protein
VSRKRSYGRLNADAEIYLTASFRGLQAWIINQGKNGSFIRIVPIYKQAKEYSILFRKGNECKIGAYILKIFDFKHFSVLGLFFFNSGIY